MSADCDLNGLFTFGNISYTKCYVSPNGFIYFNNPFGLLTYNPFSDITWKTIAPFAGDVQPTDTDAIIIKKTNDTVTFEFNCYSRFNDRTNLLNYSVVLYLDNHAERANQIDFIYKSSEFRNSAYFSQNYYIGYSDGIVQKCLNDSDNINKFSYGNSHITSTNIFPENSTIIKNVTNITTNKILTNSSNITAYGIPLSLLSPANNYFNYFGTMYKTFNISSNGYIFFGTDGSGPLPTTIDLFSNSTWKIVVPFGGYLVTTEDGIILTYEPDSLTILFNCYSMYGLKDNILKFNIVLHLNNSNKPNQIDFNYISCNSSNVNFRNDYHIGFSNGQNHKSVYDANGLFLTNGRTSIQTNNKFPQNGSKIENITNLITNTDTLLIFCYDTIKTKVNIGNIFKFGLHTYTKFNISTNGFIYFDTDNTCPPIDSTTNPFTDNKWIIIAPFCGKFKTTKNGITISRTNTECIIKWNCYVHSGSVSDIISFYLILHLDGSNSFEFVYDNNQNNNLVINRDCYIGYCDGFTQSMLNKFNEKIFPTKSYLIKPSELFEF